MLQHQWDDTMIRMSLPFDSKHFWAYEIEFGAGGQRLGYNFLWTTVHFCTFTNRRSHQKSNR
jgi:hypothetical protein